ncbi:hypothetical protein KJ980_02890 [Patescibacteria group bacterium]|nr:hypothetical protein [Patescibacteria group bacterium]MBU4016069.1 hypothetical protein [Patescibacteria group bacterium]MBU4098572.1 hypothetical protein [Patescibacteria group bacterium]
MMEMALKAFDVDIRVANVNDYEDCTQYCLELAIGTSIKRILNLDKDIALCLESPTGSIEIEAPIPHSNLIGITVPKHEKYNKRSHGKLLHSYTWKEEWAITEPVEKKRGKISNFLYILGCLIIEFSNKIKK